MFKGIIRNLLAVACLASATVAQAADIDTSNPYIMVEQVADKTFDRFHQDKSIIDSNPDHLKVIVQEELMPYVDYKYAAYKVMANICSKPPKSSVMPLSMLLRATWFPPMPRPLPSTPIRKWNLAAPSTSARKR